MAGLAELASQIFQDLRYAWRSFKRSPGIALAAIVTIGLGVGINTGVFSLVSAVAFGGVSAAEPDRLVAISQDVQGVPRAQNNYSSFTRPEYEAYRDQTETLSGVLAYGRMWNATLGDDTPRTVVATPVSCNFFDVLGQPPVIGIGFSAAHCEDRGDAAVAIITHRMWVDRYGRDPSVLGEIVTLNGFAFQIIGVAPEGFTGIDDPYEAPQNPELTLDAGTKTAEDLADEVIVYLQSAGKLG